MDDKEVIILGTGATWRECPFDAETWTLNGGYKFTEYDANARIDKVFITDKMYTEYKTPNFNVKELNELGIPIVSRNHIEGLNYEPYPYKEIVEHFGVDYFANTFAYIIAYALYYGVGKIRMYGAEHIGAREVVEQKAGVEYWIGRAQGMGCTVEIYGDTVLMKHYLGMPYGFNRKEHKYEVDDDRVLEDWHRIVNAIHWNQTKRYDRWLKKRSFWITMG